jgi:hypothetical protein
MNKDNLTDVKKICKNLGIAIPTYYARTHRGWSPDEVLSIPRVGAVHLINGKSVYKYLKEVGGSYRIFQYRIKAGYNFYDAIVFAQERKKYKRGLKK